MVKTFYYVSPQGVVFRNGIKTELKESQIPITAILVWDGTEDKDSGWKTYHDQE